MFGTRLRQLRKQHNMTQHELGEILNISRSTVGMYEAGRRNPDFEILVGIAQQFAVSIDWLLGFSNSKLETEIVSMVKGLSEDSLDELRQYVQYLRSKETTLLFSKKLNDIRNKAGSDGEQPDK